MSEHAGIVATGAGLRRRKPPRLGGGDVSPKCLCSGRCAHLGGFCLKTCPATEFSPSPPRSGGEGWGVEARFYWASPSPQSSPRSFLRGRGCKPSFETTSARCPCLRSAFNPATTANLTPMIATPHYTHSAQQALCTLAPLASRSAPTPWPLTSHSALSAFPFRNLAFAGTTYSSRSKSAGPATCSAAPPPPGRRTTLYRPGRRSCMQSCDFT